MCATCGEPPADGGVAASRHMDSGDRPAPFGAGHPSSCRPRAVERRDKPVQAEVTAHPACRRTVHPDSAPSGIGGVSFANWTATSRCVLRAPGRPEDLKGDALREGSRVEQVKREVRPGVGEEPRALADDHRADEQVDLVNELVRE
jgi:hypothetical protein